MFKASSLRLQYFPSLVAISRLSLQIVTIILQQNEIALHHYPCIGFRPINLRLSLYLEHISKRKRSRTRGCPMLSQMGTSGKSSTSYNNAIKDLIQNSKAIYVQNGDKVRENLVHEDIPCDAYSCSEHQTIL